MVAIRCCAGLYVGGSGLGLSDIDCLRHAVASDVCHPVFHLCVYSVERSVHSYREYAGVDTAVEFAESYRLSDRDGSVDYPERERFCRYSTPILHSSVLCRGRKRRGGMAVSEDELRAICCGAGSFILYFVGVFSPRIVYRKYLWSTSIIRINV